MWDWLDEIVGEDDELIEAILGGELYADVHIPLDRRTRRNLR